MDELLNAIHLGDCIEGMNALPEGSVDLAFADPPFNIGYEYDVYHDSVEARQYLGWSAEWIAAVHRVLKPNGTFWLAIGDEYAAELKIESQNLGFHCRSWVVWYYTFGVNCTKKFTRSHAHLFHFVKDPKDFTFLDEAVRVPSARELVYNDKRANPKGRLPDDTWIIRPANAGGEMTADDFETWRPAFPPPSDGNRTWTLRPQDLEESFTSGEDTWYFPRVAGTFKERAGFHGCQMPEQLLGRIIRSCSHPAEVVLDPFSGSATTLAVAKKLGRRFIGFDLSPDYVQYGRDRLSGVHVGDPLDGSPEPLKSAPKTDEPRGGRRSRGARRSPGGELPFDDPERRFEATQIELTLTGVKEAFRLTHDGFSPDRIVADPERNRNFVDGCAKLGLVGDARTWNTLLLRLRKAGRLAEIETLHPTQISWTECDRYMFASEIALQQMIDVGAAHSIDEILCDPELAAEFDAAASRLAPGHRPLEYRWAALRLRKEAKKARTRAAILSPPKRFGAMRPVEALSGEPLPESSGLYVLWEASVPLYVGETLNLRNRLDVQFAAPQLAAWSAISKDIRVQLHPLQSPAGTFAWQSCLVKTYRQRPRLNYFELGSAT